MLLAKSEGAIAAVAVVVARNVPISDVALNQNKFQSDFKKSIK